MYCENASSQIPMIRKTPPDSYDRIPFKTDVYQLFKKKRGKKGPSPKKADSMHMLKCLSPIKLENENGKLHFPGYGKIQNWLDI